MIETDTQDNKKVKQPSRPTSMIETDKHDPGHQEGDNKHDRDRRPAKKVAAKTQNLQKELRMRKELQKESPAKKVAERTADSKELQKWAAEQARLVKLMRLRKQWEAKHREEPGYDNGMTMGHFSESATLDVIVSYRVCIQARVGQGLR